jgi:hypothetical protein
MSIELVDVRAAGGITNLLTEVAEQIGEPHGVTGLVADVVGELTAEVAAEVAGLAVEGLAQHGEFLAGALLVEAVLLRNSICTLRSLTTAAITSRGPMLLISLRRWVTAIARVMYGCKPIVRRPERQRGLRAGQSPFIRRRLGSASCHKPQGRGARATTPARTAESSR